MLAWRTVEQSLAAGRACGSACARQPGRRVEKPAKSWSQGAVTDAAEPGASPQELAESCVRFVREAVGFELDYTPDTLPVLDHYVRSGVAAAAEAGRAQEQLVALLAPAAGAYFGEVVRRRLAGARWYSGGDVYQDYRIEFEPFFLCFNPIGIAMEVAAQADVGDWNAHFQLLDEARPLVERALQASGAVRTPDYYTFSVRFEVLQQVADLLGSLESARKQRRSFGPDVYSAAHGEHGRRGEA